MNIDTPAGRFPSPVRPTFASELEACDTKGDLFQLVEKHGMIDPDALAEVRARGWLADYRAWRGGET